MSTIKYTTFYSGEFASAIYDRVFSVEIQHKGTNAPLSVEPITFTYNSPLVIEWPEMAKETPVCPSAATLVVVATKSGQYRELYTAEPNEWRMVVWQKIKGEDTWKRYWTGMLDTEFYEEPWVAKENYEVTLTFADFGILDRIAYDLTGIQSVYSVVSRAFELSGLEYSQIDTGSIVISSKRGERDGLIKSVFVRSDAMTSDDGSTMTYREVIENLLLSLGLKMVQKCSVIHIYSLDALLVYTNYAWPIKWMSSDQMYSFDKVYNRININLAVNSDAKLLSYDEETNEIIKNNTANGEYSVVAGSKNDHKYVSFYFGSSTKPSTIDLNDAAFPTQVGMFAMKAGRDGEDTGGVRMITDKTDGRVAIDGKYLFSTKSVFIPPIVCDSSSGDNYATETWRLHFDMPVLFDPRENPFYDANYKEAQSNTDCSGDFNLFQSHTYYLTLTAEFLLQNAAGETIAFLAQDNAEEIKSTSPSAYACRYYWRKGKPDAKYITGGVNYVGTSYYYAPRIMYYDPDDMMEKSGVTGGFKSCRPCIGINDQSPLGDSFKNVPGGAFIPYPTTEMMGADGCYLKTIIYKGCDTWDKARSGNKTWTKNGVRKYIKWMLYKLPSINVVNARTAMSEPECDDATYSYSTHINAKDSLDLDMKFGYYSDAKDSHSPTPKCRFFGKNTSQTLYLYKGNDQFYVTQYRVGRLLLYNYGQQCVKLSGTCAMLIDQLSKYKEPSLGNKIFMITSDVQDLQQLTSEATFVEVKDY